MYESKAETQLRCAPEKTTKPANMLVNKSTTMMMSASFTTGCGTTGKKGENEKREKE